jgi:LPXTG-site transpeptidase (sortase) family protein
MDAWQNATQTANGSKRQRFRKRPRYYLMVVLKVLTIVAAVSSVAIGLYLWYDHRKDDQYATAQQDQLRQQLEAQETLLALANTTTTTVVLTPEEKFRAAAAAFTAEFPYPATPDKARAGNPIGRITIPKIGVDKVLVQGAGEGDDSYLKEGPGHWPETAWPGQGGNFVISGHRTTYGAPFKRINELRPGDEITIEMPYAVVRYVVTGTVIIRPIRADLDVVAVNHGKEELTLMACHPRGSARQRIVVQADMVDFVLKAPTGE